MTIRHIFRAIGWVICTAIPGRGEREAGSRLAADRGGMLNDRLADPHPAVGPAGTRPAAVSVPPTPPAVGHQRLGQAGSEFTGSAGMQLLVGQVEAHRLTYCGPLGSPGGVSRAVCACNAAFEAPNARHLWAAHAAGEFLARFQGRYPTRQFETGQDMGLVHAAELFPQHTKN